MGKRVIGWHSEGFRAMALERLRSCQHIGKLCEELGVSPSTLRQWRRQMESRGDQAPVTAVVPGETLVEENRRLKRALAEKVLEVDFLQGALHQVAEQRRRNSGSGAPASTPKSGE